jgi:L-seryl-tRNA(Ser) seleniumtransferase
MVGRRDAVAAAARHPLARALRIDKLSLAALEATLALYRDPDLAAREIPVLAMLNAPAADLQRRAGRLAEATGGEVIQSASRVGGGALPLLELRGPAVALDAGAGGAEALALALRRGEPPLLARIHEGRLLLDPRTLSDEEAAEAAEAIRAALA